MALYLEKFLKLKISGPKEICGLKKCYVKKIFGMKKIFGWKKICCPKEMLSSK